MPGFRITNLREIDELNNWDQNRCEKGRIDYNNWIIQRNTLSKFMDDKMMFENDGYIIVLEGLIYNKFALEKLNNCSDYGMLIVNLFKNRGIQFINDLDGIMSGLIFDKNNQEIYCFTSKMGEKALFYYHNKGNVIVGSQLNYLTELLKANDVPKKPNIVALRQFMAYGYYLDNSTAVDGIYRLMPGHYIKYNVVKDMMSIMPYFVPDYKQKNSMEQEETIDLLDEYFCEALEKAKKKNMEYGYKTILDISAGADSRMICYASKKINMQNVLLNCFAQSGCNDEIVAKKIAYDLGYDCVIRPLDTANCLMNIDENIRMNNGTAGYFTITGGKDMLHMLDRYELGIECTGLLGDVYDGSMVVDRCDGHICKDYHRYRNSLVLEYGRDFEVQDSADNMFKNHINGHFWFYTRGALFGMATSFIRQNFTEVMTPYGDPKFMELYLTIPWDERVKNKLLRKWMIRKYPEAADTIYGDTMLTITQTVESSCIRVITSKVMRMVNNYWPFAKYSG